MNNSMLNKIYGITSWITNLAFINILWLSFTLLGIIILGFFPSTVAMISVLKKLLVAETDINIFREFLTSYKQEFKKSNQLYLPFILIGFILIIDIRFILIMNFPYSQLLVGIFYLLIFFLAMTFLYSLVVYINSTAGKREIVKKSFILLLTSPITNFYLLTIICLMYLLTVKVVGLIFLFSGSLLGLMTLLIVVKTKGKI